jgi:hypothetical protein
LSAKEFEQAKRKLLALLENTLPARVQPETALKFLQIRCSRAAVF